LNIKGMMRNPNLALSVADTAMSRLVTLRAYKADWRERRIEEIDPWFPSTQACCQCGRINTDMENLIDAHSPAPSAGTSKVGIAMQHATSTGTARNAGTMSAKTLSAGRLEQGHAFGFVPVPIVETRVETHGGYHESQ
jgi:hypothetical protein